MVAIVTRAGKGSPLTHSEVDANFNNLNAGIAAAAALYNPANVAITGGTLDGLQRVGFSAVAGGASDVILNRDAANTLALRNGANAQAFNVYNTYTDASNYELASFDWTTSPNTLTIGTRNAGTGVARGVRLISATGALIVAATVASDGVGARDLGGSSNSWKRLYIDYTNTGTVGAVTINKAAGRVNIAAAGTSLVVTNSLVTAASKVFAQVSQADGTAYIKNVVPAAGSFTITLGAAATAQTSIDFFVVNAD